MVESKNSIKIEFILQRIDEILIRDFPVEQVFRELCHYELIYETYCQQKYSPFEFINLQIAFNDFVIELEDRQKIDKDCLASFFKHCQQIERTFSSRDLTAIQNLITKQSFWSEQSCDRNECRVYLQKLCKVYNSWCQQQSELRESKLLLPEDTIDFDLEIDRLLVAEIKQQREKISQIENKSIEILNRLYSLISPLNKICPNYCSRNVFLEIIEQPVDNSYRDLFAGILQRKYRRKIAQAQWEVVDYGNNYLELKGGFIYEELYTEAGIHQATQEQLESFVETDEDWRDRNLPEMETSKAFSIEVDVIPQPSLTEIPEINYRDLKIKSTTINPGCGVRFNAFTLLHQPTQITATICDRHLSRKSMYLLIKILAAQIYCDRLKPIQSKDSLFKGKA